MPPPRFTRPHITKSSPFNWWWLELIENKPRYRFNLVQPIRMVAIQSWWRRPSIKMIPAVERSFERKLNLFNWRLIRLTCPKRRISQDWKSKGIVTTCYDGKDCEQKGVVWRCLHEFSFEDFEPIAKYCMYKIMAIVYLPRTPHSSSRFPGDSRWPCHPLVRGHAKPCKGSRITFQRKVTKNCRQPFGLLRIELNLSELWVSGSKWPIQFSDHSNSFQEGSGSYCRWGQTCFCWDTAPVDVVDFPVSIGFCTSQVVQDFFHPQ